METEKITVSDVYSRAQSKLITVCGYLELWAYHQGNFNIPELDDLVVVLGEAREEFKSIAGWIPDEKLEVTSRNQRKN